MIEKLVRYAFYAILGLQIAGGLLLISHPDLIFASAYVSYGPLRNNLIFVVGYITIAELLLMISRYVSNGFREIIMMGAILVITTAGVQFYASINDIALNGNVLLLGVVFAVCHFGYGFYMAWTASMTSPRL